MSAPLPSPGALRIRRLFATINGKLTTIANPIQDKQKYCTLQHNHVQQHTGQPNGWKAHENIKLYISVNTCHQHIMQQPHARWYVPETHMP